MEISTMYLSMKEKEAIRTLEGCRDFWKEQLEKPTISEEDTKIANKEIEHDTILLNLIDKQNKVIDEMIEEYEFNARINVKDFCEECQRKDKCIQDCHTHVKQYFIRKVNGDGKN